MIKFDGPIVWYDVNRVARMDVQRAIDARPNWVFVAVMPGAHPPIGIVHPQYPSPEDLFHWAPKVIEQA